VITHPTADELLQAVIDWLGGDQRDGYLALVARNALGIVQRELAQGAAADRAARARLREFLGSDEELPELEQRLCDDIRTGEVDPDDPALLHHLRLQTLAHLQIDQPKYKSSLVLSFKKEHPS
jgi:hypothetical protein